MNLVNCASRSWSTVFCDLTQLCIYDLDQLCPFILVNCALQFGSIFFLWALSTVFLWKLENYQSVQWVYEYDKHCYCNHSKLCFFCHGMESFCNNFCDLCVINCVYVIFQSMQELWSKPDMKPSSQHLNMANVMCVWWALSSVHNPTHHISCK